MTKTNTNTTDKYKYKYKRQIKRRKQSDKDTLDLWNKSGAGSEAVDKSSMTKTNTNTKDKDKDTVDLWNKSGAGSEAVACLHVQLLLCAQVHESLMSALKSILFILLFRFSILKCTSR